MILDHINEIHLLAIHGRQMLNRILQFLLSQKSTRISERGARNVDRNVVRF